MAHKVIILGASGYTGAELVRLIASHPDMEIAALSADSKAGLEMAGVFPHLRHMSLPRLKKSQILIWLKPIWYFAPCRMPRHKL